MRKLTIWAVLCLPVSALYAQKHTLIVFHPDPHTIDEIDPVNGKILHILQVADQPHEAAIAPDGGKIYASLPGPGEVVIIDPVTFTQKGKIESEYFNTPPHTQGRSGKISTSAGPHALGLNNDGSKLYVGLGYRDGPGIVVYDVKQEKTLTKIDIPIVGEFLKVQPGTDKLYNPNHEGITVIDTKTDKVLKTIPAKDTPTGADFAPNGEVWISNDVGGGVVVVDGKKDEIVKGIPTKGEGASRIAVSPNGKWAAAAHATSGDVVILDVAGKKVVSTVDIGKGYALPVFSPDSTKLYVMTGGGPCTEACPGHVVVIDVRQMKVRARYKVADDAFAVVVRPASGTRKPGN